LEEWKNGSEGRSAAVPILPSFQSFIPALTFMRCNKAQIWLQGYVDGELSPRRMQKVRKHMDHCAECKSELSRLSELKTLLTENRGELVMDASPEFFWSQVKGRIQGEVKPRQVWRWTFQFDLSRVLAWATACVVIGAVATFVWMQTWPQPAQVAVVTNVRPAVAKVDWIVTKGPELYAEAYHSKQSGATIIWTEGMPVITLEL
jgi:anti-sigma factor RsiW